MSPVSPVNRIDGTDGVDGIAHVVTDRGGHLPELVIDRYLYDPADGAFRAEVEHHLAQCEACRLALEAIALEDAEYTPVRMATPRVQSDPAARLSPPPQSGLSLRAPHATETSSAEIHVLRPTNTASPFAASPNAKPGRWTRVRVLLQASSVLLAAALLLFVVLPREGPHGTDEIRLKGTSFELEVHVHDGIATRRVLDGDVVHPGERMGFLVRANRAGHIIIVGRDVRGETYLCYPQGLEAHAVDYVPSDALTDLEVAMAFDDVLGHEQVVAYLCDHPLTFAELTGPVASATPLGPVAGCLRRELTLDKRPRPLEMLPPGGRR